MASSFEFEVSVHADTKQLETALNDSNRSAKDLGETLNKFAAKLPGEQTKKINIQMVGIDKASGTFKVQEDGLEGLTGGLRKAAQGFNALTGAEQGSIKSIQGHIARLSRQRDAMNSSNASRLETIKTINLYKQQLLSAQGIEEGSVTALQSQAKNLRELANSYKIGSPQQKRFVQELREVEAQLAATEGPFKGILNAFDKLARFQTGFIAVQAAIQSITGSLNNFINQAKQVEGFELALKNVGLSAVQTNAALQEASDIANELGAPISQVEKSYKRMVPALKAVGANAKTTSKFIQNITARTQTLGLNTEQSGRFLEAFAQVLSKGKLQAEELNQQISELDGAFRVQLADALGVTTEELENLISTGQVTASVFVDAVNRMQNGTEELRRRVESGNYTIQQLQNLIGNLRTQNLRTIGAALEPGIKAFFEIEKVFQDFVASIANSEFGKFFAESVNGIIIGIKNFVVILTEGVKATMVFLDPIFAVIRALNNILSPLGGVIGLVTTYVAAITSAAIAQKALNVATKLSEGNFKALNVVVSISNKLFGAVATKIKAINFQEMISGLTGLVGGFAGAAKGAKSMSGVTYESATAVFDLAAAAKGGGPELLGLATEQAGAAAAAGKLTAGMVLAGAAIAAVAGVAAILYKNWEYGNEAAKALDGSTKGLRETLASLNVETKKTPGFWDNVGGALASVGRDIARFFGAESAALDGAKRGYQDYKAALADAFVEMTKLGVQVYDNASIQNASDKGLSKSVKIQRDVVAAVEQAIKALKEKIAKAKEEKNLNLAAELEKQLAAQEKMLPVEREVLKNLENEIALRKRLKAETGNNINDLDELNAYMERQNTIIESSKLEQLTANQEKYGKIAANSAKLAISNLAAEQTARQKQIELVNDQISNLKRLSEAEGISEEERTKRLNKLYAAQNDLKKLELERAQARNEASKIIQDTLEKEFAQSSKLSQTYMNIAKSINSASSSAMSGVSTLVGTMRSAVDTVMGFELKGLKKGTQERKNLITIQLRSQMTLSRLETQIAKMKNDTSTKIAIMEMRVLQARLRGEAAIARMKGANKEAQQLEAQARNMDTIVKLRIKENQLNNRNLDLQQRIKEEQLIQKGVDEKIAGNFRDRKRAAHETASQLGTQKLTMGEINNYTRATVDDMQEIKELSGDVDVNLGRSDLAQANALPEATKKAAELGDNFNTASNNAAEMYKRVMAVRDGVVRLNSELQNTQSILGAAGGARWMGGPVEGGQTYRVNDAGLGREAFMNKFGNIKMLPAGSNINWTAPSSGTIIPAAMVRQMQKNASINTNINQQRASGGPALSSPANTALGGNSGNLVKQMTAALGASGGTQRITNNVTIQSQQPVTDASQIMTNVARMRLRNGRRI